MKHLIAIFMLMTLSLETSAKLSKPSWEVVSGTITYHVSYLVKSVDGISKNVRGKGNCAAGICQFLIAVPVKSFESGDGNRDNHMLEVTKAALYPMATVKVSFPENTSPTSVEARAEVNFAGKSHAYEKIKIDVQSGAEQTTTTGTIPMTLSDFDVERPSLLTVKIDDSVPVHFDLRWH